MLVWHRSTEILNLSVIPVYSGLVVPCRVLGTLRVSPFPNSALPPFCSDYELRCKTESQQIKQSKPSAVFVFLLTPQNLLESKSRLLNFYLSSKKTQRKSAVYKEQTKRNATPHIFIYI